MGLQNITSVFQCFLLCCCLPPYIVVLVPISSFVVYFLGNWRFGKWPIPLCYPTQMTLVQVAYTGTDLHWWKSLRNTRNMLRAVIWFFHWSNLDLGRFTGWLGELGNWIILLRGDWGRIFGWVVSISNLGFFSSFMFGQFVKFSCIKFLLFFILVHKLC